MNSRTIIKKVKTVICTRCGKRIEGDHHRACPKSQGGCGSMLWKKPIKFLNKSKAAKKRWGK